MLSPYLDIASSTWDIRDDRERANVVKAALIAMAGTTLKASVGEEYANIVVSCLVWMLRAVFATISSVSQSVQFQQSVQSWH